MALQFTNNVNGSFFTAFGILAGGQREVIALMNATVEARTANINTQYYNNTFLKPEVDGLYENRDSFRSTHLSYCQDLQQQAQDVLVRLVKADQGYLPDTSIPTVISELIAQMTGSQNITRNNVTITVVPSASNNGSAILVASVYGADGKILQYCYNESTRGTVTADPVSSGSPGSITLLGALPADSPFAFNWPQGSGASVTVPIVTSHENASTNLLSNSDFNAFNAGMSPSQWIVSNGTANGTVTSCSTVTVDGSNSLVFVGNGSGILGVQQSFNDTTNGTTSILSPLTVYPFNCFLRSNTTSINGTIVGRFVDGNSTQILNANGTQANVTLALTGVISNTTWYAFNGTLTTPEVLPAVVRFELKSTVAMNNSLYIDCLALTEGTEFYTMGPIVAAFEGVGPAYRGDIYAMNVTNAYVGVIQTEMWRNFDMPSLGLQIPSNVTGSISDSLVV